jgi:hypothetical protein
MEPNRRHCGHGFWVLQGGLELSHVIPNSNGSLKGISSWIYARLTHHG